MGADSRDGADHERRHFERLELMKDVRRAVGRLVHTQEQISARIEREGGTPTEEEWDRLKELVGDDEA